MPPKVRFTREDIVRAAFEITREQGRSAVTARSVAARLGSTPKVIFTGFSGMEELNSEVFSMAYRYYENWILDAMKSGKYPPYKASGMAYISFARDERELFKLIFMRDRNDADSAVEDRSVKPIIEMIMKSTGLDEKSARMFHLEQWVCVHGIASMIATGYLKWDDELVSEVLSDSYMGLRTRFIDKMGEKDGCDKN